MSDGHFNRSLLPAGDFQSGLRAGRARTCTRAEEAFIMAVTAAFPEASEDEKAKAIGLFRKHLLEED